MSGLERNVFEVILECAKPTMAAINGSALGAGCELALACDIRLMVDDAQIGLPEAKRGMGANFASVILPRLIPRAIAFEMLYCGDPMDAPMAAAIGLVNRVWPRTTFLADVEGYSQNIAANAPLTLQRYKQMMIKGSDLPAHSALRLNVGPDPYGSRDRVEGVRAFLDRRRPVWSAE